MTTGSRPCVITEFFIFIYLFICVFVCVRAPACMFEKHVPQEIDVSSCNLKFRSHDNGFTKLC